ncbi:unnamed protein product [Acanthoscelides obtectus]|uniref:Cyclin-dependent kinase 2-interacting protein n=1 Tax=Acanthoscelides obtectus TaxID=200917 RepID=A0A9P0KLW8_ACAOB|nr:unnamed protein product [Acanthoscelides obtectus]CAK1639558.1 Cyclin-dependent kinase 2-interacting protein [Acanthoscelides obtectus]
MKMSQTPRRTPNSNSPGFAPVKLHQSPIASPNSQKNLTGVPRVVRDLAADLYNNVQKWNNLHIRGAQLCKQIAICKTDKPFEYSPELETLTNNLYECVDELTPIKETFEMIIKQAEAMKKLQKTPEPVFFGHKMEGLVEMVHYVANAYVAEYSVKQTVLENIAHTQSKDEVMFFATFWTLQTNVDDRVTLKLESLLTETCHRTID